MTGRRRRDRAATGALLAALGLALALAAGFFGHLHPALDSFAHFRLHLAVLIAICGLALLTLRAPLPALLSLLVAAGSYVGASTHGPFSVKASADTTQRMSEAARYRLLHLNLRFDHAEPERVFSLIARHAPDVISLNEVSAMWREKLDLIEAAYPHRLICETTRRVGAVAILSRRPLRAGASHCMEEGRLAVATVDLDGREVRIAALHLDWPWPMHQWSQIRRFAPAIGELADTPLVLAGDFNATPWSAAVRHFAGHGGLTVAGDIGPTWLHRSMPPALRAIAGLPIDQIMWKGGIVMENAGSGADAGSDHLPVIADFSLEPAPAPPPVALALTDTEPVAGRPLR